MGYHMLFLIVHIKKKKSFISCITIPCTLNLPLIDKCTYISIFEIGALFHFTLWVMWFNAIVNRLLKVSVIEVY